MKKVTLPGVEKEGESTSPSKQKSDSAFRPASQDVEDEEVSSGPRRLLPEELMGLVVPSLKVGAGTGMLGMFVGATAGIIRIGGPVTFSIITGLQWSILGSTFYGSRQAALQYLKEKEEPASGEKVKASAIAGAFAGTMGGLVRGPKNIIPGAISFALFGTVGQAAVNAYQRRKAAAKEKEEKGGFLASKWSPLTKLSDEEYEMIIQEKILRVEAEMAIIDEQIKEVRAAEAQRASQRASEKENSPSA